MLLFEVFSKTLTRICEAMWFFIFQSTNTSPISASKENLFFPNRTFWWYIVGWEWFWVVGRGVSNTGGWSDCTFSCLMMVGEVTELCTQSYCTCSICCSAVTCTWVACTGEKEPRYWIEHSRCDPILSVWGSMVTLKRNFGAGFFGKCYGHYLWFSTNFVGCGLQGCDGTRICTVHQLTTSIDVDAAIFHWCKLIHLL